MRERYEKSAVVALLLIGLGLRVVYLFGRGALWGDEGALAMNIVPPSFAEVADPFVFDQICPYGFLIAAKALTLVLGHSDAALRTLPCIMGMAACVFVYLAAAEGFGRTAGIVALACAALSPELMYYSVELKPYSSDAAVAALMLFLIFHTLACEGRAYDRWLLTAGVVGVVVAWLSLTSLMVLGGAGITLAYDAATRRPIRRRLWWIVLIGVAWLGSYGLNYVLITSASPVMSDEGAVVYWAEGFLPFPPKSLADLKWPVGKFFYAFVDPGGFRRRYFAGLVWLFGFFMLLRRYPRYALGLASPIVLLAVASAMGRYPALSRLMLLSFPFLVIPIGYAVSVVLEARMPAKPRRLLAAALLVALLAEPTYGSFQQAGDRFDEPGVDRAVEILAAAYREGDAVYIDGIEWQYFWYAYKNGFDAYAVGVNDIREDFGNPGHYPGVALFKDLYFGRPRVWLVLSNVGIAHDIENWDGSREPLDVFIPRFLDAANGRREADHRFADARLMLYDLSDVRTSSTSTTSSW